jgi:serine/threonine-protein kinase
MIGRVLDKYEILEEVGQGGMSVVYKGLDTSLRREVAVKVLHPHLAGHAEARRRFEREAQAVAKLRHENILEIFDYSGNDSSESYIVTEFIRGKTLKDFISDHKVAFPEIGAMMVAEICRALGHAHALGVLHRDVKPENIMIRDDGVLKLMDFGIAQIVDAQRMTVTGQLLGSPAYMSPEHVEGKPLDFRTDVFSVGILLYQVTTGELPFKGRNPHEILKRIAETRYIDARVVNPLVGERLGRIIAKALAHDPDDRFADVAPMLDDLVSYLGEAELGDARPELARFFAQPVSYEQALRQRLIAAFSRRGKSELAARRTNVALELFNRVLTIDPANEDVLKEIDKLSRRRRLTRGVALGGVLAVALAGVAAAKTFWPAGGGAAAEQALVAEPVVAPDAAVLAALPPDAAPVVVVPAADAMLAVAPEPDSGPRNVVIKPRTRPDAGAVDVGTHDVKLVAGYPGTITYVAETGETGKITQTRPAVLPLPRRPVKITFSNDSCCLPKTVVFDGDNPGDTIVLEARNAKVTVKCIEAESITIDGQAIAHGETIELDLDEPRKVVVVFKIGGKPDPPEEKVIRPGQIAEIKCEPPQRP